MIDTSTLITDSDLADLYFAGMGEQRVEIGEFARTAHIRGLRFVAAHVSVLTENLTEPREIVKAIDSAAEHDPRRQDG